MANIYTYILTYLLKFLISEIRPKLDKGLTGVELAVEVGKE